MPPIVARPSPNFDLRPAGTPIDLMVLHYTGMVSAAAALEHLCDEASKVSAHYMIDEDGTIFQLVDEEKRAWHAGVACWADATNINDRSIGIELVNPGHVFGYRPFPEAQMEALEALAGVIVAHRHIPRTRVLGHSDVAPNRKRDPGELFDWGRLARLGIALGPPPPGTTAIELAGPAMDLREAQVLLARIGYDIAVNNEENAAHRNVITAFQRHFRPAQVDGRLDRETVACLRRVVAALD